MRKSLDNKQGGVLAQQPEQQARGNIDRLLEVAGWHVCDRRCHVACLIGWPHE
jgi:hypothetical protein